MVKLPGRKMKRSRKTKAPIKELIFNDLGERVMPYRPYVHLRSCKGTPGNVEDLKARIRFDPGNPLQKIKTSIYGHPCGHQNINYYGHHIPRNNSNEMTVLENAAALGHVECCRVLIEVGGHGEAITDQALTNAVGFRNLKTLEKCVDVTKVLIENGNFTTECYKKLISYCINIDINTELLEILLENKNKTEKVKNIKKSKAEIRSDYVQLTYELFKRKFNIAVLLLLYGAPLNKPFPTSNQLFQLPHDLLRLNPYDLLRALNIYKMFGGNMWTQRSSRRKFKPTFLQELELSPRLDHYLAVLPDIEELVRTPLSLQAISRLAVKEAIGTDLRREVNALPLPPALKRYLCFQDLESSSEVNTQPGTCNNPFPVHNPHWYNLFINNIYLTNNPFFTNNRVW